MTRTLLLFDIDGTLLTTGGAGMRAMRRTARDLFGSDFNWDGVQANGSLDPVIFADAARLNGVADHQQHHDAFRAQYLLHLERELSRADSRVQTMPGVRPLLATLRLRVRASDDLVLGMLSGNYRGAVPLKLGPADLDPEWFTLTALGDEAPTRPDLVRLALQRYRQTFGEDADTRRVIVIGDTPRDVDCARTHDCVAFAVATGDHSVSELIAAGADHAVTDLSDPAPLLTLLD